MKKLGDAPSPTQEHELQVGLAAAIIVGLDRAWANGLDPSDSLIQRGFRMGVLRAALEIADGLPVLAGLAIVGWVRRSRLADQARDGAS